MAVASHIPHCIKREKDVLKESKMKRRLLILRNKLIAIGGEAVLLPMVEDDIDVLLERGTITPQRRKPNLMLGEGSRCHSNIANLREQNPERLTIVTGYGLSDDGLWRQHSWGWDKYRQEIVETTVLRNIYWGAKLRKKEADDFCENNW